MHRSSTSEKSTIDGSSLEDEAFSPSAPSHPRFSRRGSGKMTSDGDGEGDGGEGDDGHVLGSLPPPEGEAPRLGLHWEQIGPVAQAQIAGCSQSSPSSISSR